MKAADHLVVEKISLWILVPPPHMPSEKAQERRNIWGDKAAGMTGINAAIAFSPILNEQAKTIIWRSINQQMTLHILYFRQIL